MKEKAKRALHWVLVALVIGVLAYGSYTEPEIVVWVAWLMAGVCWAATYFQREAMEQAEESRDRWRVLAGRMEAERNAAEREAEDQRLMRDEAVYRLNEENERLRAELARLRPYAEQTHASAALFAAARRVVEVAGKGSDEEVDLALVLLEEAVARWGKVEATEESSDAQTNR